VPPKQHRMYKSSFLKWLIVSICCIRERGQILPLAALSMVTLMSFAAMAVDAGNLYAVKRHMQTAADAAAIAAANQLQSSESSGYQQAATDVAALNGFTSGTNDVTVTVSDPPANGEYAGTQSYVQVAIEQAVPTYFLRILGYNSFNVAVSATAGTVSGPFCIYALDPSASNAISLTGNFSINASCGLVDDSSSSSALSGTGNGTVKTTETGVVGNYSSAGNVSFTPTPKTHIAPASDPLSALAAPSVGTCAQATVNESTAYTVSGINPVITVPVGIYPNSGSGGISIGGNNPSVTFISGTYGNGVIINGNSGSITFNPGQYQDSGNGAAITIEGNAGTVFNAGTYTICGGLSIVGNNVVTLSPGLYSGGISITGNANVTFRSGTYVLAGGGLSVTGNSTLTGTGVTFYDTTGPGGYKPINLTGNETANLSAPTSGSLEGILFYQDRSIPTGSAASTITGNSSSTFDGVIYFPTTSLKFTGNSSSSGYTFLIADTLTITGNSSMALGDNYSSLSDGSPIKSSALYE
jgi:hypothetical protein